MTPRSEALARFRSASIAHLIVLECFNRFNSDLGEETWMFKPILRRLNRSARDWERVINPLRERVEARRNVLDIVDSPALSKGQFDRNVALLNRHLLRQDLCLFRLKIAERLVDSLGEHPYTAPEHHPEIQASALVEFKDDFGDPKLAEALDALRRVIDLDALPNYIPQMLGSPSDDFNWEHGAICVEAFVGLRGCVLGGQLEIPEGRGGTRSLEVAMREISRSRVSLEQREAKEFWEEAGGVWSESDVEATGALASVGDSAIADVPRPREVTVTQFLGQ